MRWFGFTLTGKLAHLVTVRGEVLCGQKIFYIREDSRDYPICQRCKARNDEGRRLNLLPENGDNEKSKARLQSR